MHYDGSIVAIPFGGGQRSFGVTRGQIVKSWEFLVNMISQEG